MVVTWPTVLDEELLDKLLDEALLAEELLEEALLAEKLLDEALLAEELLDEALLAEELLLELEAWMLVGLLELIDVMVELMLVLRLVVTIELDKVPYSGLAQWLRE